MPRNMLQALMDEEKLGRRANPGEARALGPTIPMRIGATLNPMLERVQDIFPKDNPYGSFIERLIVGDSPERTGRMAEGIPHQYTGAGPNDPIVRPQIVDLAAALPSASTLKLAKAAAVPAAMATGAAALNRLKAPGYAATSTEDIASALLTPALQRQGGALDDAMVAYHGSPHEFDVLDPTKIGTGEGAQAYGHGIYVAENPRVAGGYQTSLPYAEMKRKFLKEIPEDAEFEELMDLVADGYFSPQQERVIKALEADDWLGFDYPSQAISEAYGPDLKNFDPSPELVESIKGLSGHLYDIDVPDEDIAKMLDWDAPLSEQPESVRNALKDLIAPNRQELIRTLDDLFDQFAPQGYSRERFDRAVNEALEFGGYGDEFGYSVWDEINEASGGFFEGEQEFARVGDSIAPTDTGASLYKLLDAKYGGGAEASAKLTELGIPGIKYYDQGSRAAGEGTRNMVLFDDLARRAKVLKRNDEKIAEPSVDEFIGKLLED